MLSKSITPAVSGPIAGLLLCAPLLVSCSVLGLGQEEEPATVIVGTPGALEVGDPYYPGSGSGGIDAQLYDLDLSVDMESGALVARAVIDLRATQDLSAFSLDFGVFEIGSLSIDGDEAQYRRDGNELIITLAQPLAEGTDFRCEVEYSGVPGLIPDASLAKVGLPGVGWWKMSSGIYTLSECVGAASWFPCNDHPTDKARLRLRVTVDEPWVVAANGLLVEEVIGTGANGLEQRTYQFDARDPMATYLATVNIARFNVTLEEGPEGLPLVLYAPLDAKEKELAAFARTGEMITYFSELFGPYPFECFGGVISYEQVGGALETQTLPVYSRGAGEGVVAHELAHQWFGNAVSIERWEDLWLNEGFASYAELLWVEHTDGKEAMEKRAARSYRSQLQRRTGAPHDPGVANLWSARAYQRGSVLLHALRGEIGDDLFFEVLRQWVARNLHGNANTAEFIALTEELAKRELDEFFDVYLYGEMLPVITTPAGSGPGGKTGEAETPADTDSGGL
ncbi:MAG: aminopeptidase N [Gammaproteobacteria bacterium]|jgi:aminopeptidase N